LQSLSSLRDSLDAAACCGIFILRNSDSRDRTPLDSRSGNFDRTWKAALEVTGD
jgi:hypothetical protein